MKRAWAGLALVMSSMTSRGAVAREPERDFTERPLAIQGQLGVGTMVGSLGLIAGWSFAPAFELGAGVGLGAFGFEPGAYLRARPLTWTSTAVHALGIDLGVSTSAYRDYWDVARAEDPASYRADRVYWLQFEGGWERRAFDGTTVRVALGAARVLDPGSIRCESAVGVECGEPALFVPVASFAFGYAFAP